jgi:glycosyltransferase involved in cell wall biosynthesis
MKILMVNKFLHPNGGSETYIFKLGEYLTSIGNEVQYFGMEHEGRIVGNNAEQYTQNMDFHGGSKLKQLTYPFKTIYSTEAKKKLTIVLNDFKPDVIHINNFNYQLTPSIIYAANEYKKRAGKKVKIVFTAHDYQLICPNHQLYSEKDYVCEKCIGAHFGNCVKNKCIHSSTAKSLIGTIEATVYNSLKTYKYIDCVICPSDFMKNKMDTNPIFKGKTITLHNFIDTVNTAPSNKKDYVLYFGRYSREKGIYCLVNSTNTNFVCAGSGEFEDYIDKASNTENVGFKTGEELIELIKGAKCTVYPSVWYENCPFSIMESISYGTPVVASNIGGIPELIDDQKTGILFEPNNIEEFESAIHSITDDDKKADQMSKNCLNKHFYTVEEYAQKLLNIYQ